MKWKKIIKVALCMALIILLSLGTVLTGFAAKEDKFTLRVGYWNNYGISQDKNGNLYGYLYDYVQKICKINNWEAEFISCDWVEGMEKLEKGEIDVFGPLQKTVERELQFEYPQIRMGYEYGSLSVKNNNDTIFYDDLSSIDGKILGTVENNYYLEILKLFCLEKNISIDVKIINDINELNRQFINGDIDMQISGSMLTPENSKVVLNFATEEFYLPTTKGNLKVLNGLNKAINDIRQENLYYEAELYNKYYTKTSVVNKAFTAEEKDFIKTSPALKIGYESTGVPLEYYDKDSNAASGITINLLKNIEEYSGIKFEFIKTDSFEQANEMIEKGEIQLMSGLIGGEYFDEIYGLKQSQPIVQTKLAFITKKGEKFDSNNITIAIPENWWGMKKFIGQNYASMKIVTYPTIEHCLNAVLDGKANASIQNTFSVDRILKTYKYQQLVIHGAVRGEISICLGFPKDTSDILISVLNKSIDSISDNTRDQAIYEHTIGVSYEPTFSEKIKYNAPTLFVCICTFLVVMYLFSIHTRNELNELAYYDPLTGEMNLNKFKIEVKKIVRFSKEPHAIMVLDIDKFKSVNDIYGYDFGDKMLIFLAKEIRNTFKSAELFSKGHGDRFYVFFKYENNEKITDEFHELTEKADIFRFDDNTKCKIILSGGICVISSDEDVNVISLIDRANIASKQIKGCHTSSFTYYDQSMYDKINREKTIENAMKSALDNNEFIIYLQPKVELSSRKAVGAEALVRWLKPNKGLIAPGEFIPLFEENGFIIELDFYVLKQVGKMLERWKKEGRELFTISVNLSRRHLEDENTAKILKEIISVYDIEPKYIEIELTESAFDNCNILTITTLFDELHSYGFTVSVDDFGAGYSSLALLKDLPIDVLKIDKSFFDCQSGCKNDKMQLLLESVISLSRKLNIKTVSEGVETVQQVNLLVQLGCDLVQGFYFARPMPINQLEKVLDIGALYEVNEITRVVLPIDDSL